MALVKARLYWVDSKSRVVNQSKYAEMQFNPTELKVSKTNSWDQKEVTGENASNAKFAGGKSRTLTFDTLYDSYEEGTDVRLKFDTLYQLTRIDPSTINSETKKGTPPLTMFSWGATSSGDTDSGLPPEGFIGYLNSLNIQYILFLENGTPARAKVSVSLTEAPDDPTAKTTNPTSYAEAGYKRVMVQPRETLAWIAYREYGNSASWRRIAETNRLTDPLAIHEGQYLTIPPLK